MLTRNTDSHLHTSEANGVCHLLLQGVCACVPASSPHRTAPAKTRWKRVAMPRSPAKVERLIANSIKSATPLIAAETSLFFFFWFVFGGGGQSKTAIEERWQESTVRL